MPDVIGRKSAESVSNAYMEYHTTQRYISWKEARSLEKVTVGKDWREEEEGYYCDNRYPHNCHRFLSHVARLVCVMYSPNVENTEG
jgi:hypothetical protein